MQVDTSCAHSDSRFSDVLQSTKMLKLWPAWGSSANNEVSIDKYVYI